MSWKPKVFPLALCLVVLAGGVAPLAAQGHRVVYYYRATGPWINYPNSLPELIRFDLMTHLIFFNADAITNNATFQPPPAANIAALQDIQRVARDHGVKVLYGIPATFSAIKTNILLTSATRAPFIQAVSNFVAQYHLDGVDFDFEHPVTAAETALMGTFCTEVRQALGRQTLITAAVAAAWASGNTTGSITPSVVNDSLDWLNVMNYLSSAHYTVAHANNDLNEFANLGVARSKLVLGVPFYGKVDASSLTLAYSALLPYLIPYSPDSNTVAIDTNTYYFNNRTMQRQKMWDAATNANGTMVWELSHDSRDPALSLAVALNEERTNKLACIDGFEHPPGALLDVLYTRSNCALAITNDRVAGDAALLAAFTFSGAQYSGGSFLSPTLAAGYAFPTNAFLRLDLRVLNPLTNGTFYLAIFDGAGKQAQRFDAAVLRTNGWQRLLWNRASFSPEAGFDFGDIRQYRLLAQLASAAPASTNAVIFDNFVMYQPDPANAPVAVDLDSDGDGLCDALEAAYGTNPLLADTDGDGRTDTQEMFTDHANPLDAQRLVSQGAVWRYNDTGANLGTAWQANGYNDSAWSIGPGPLGFGTGDEATLVSSNQQTCTYFRKTFTASSANNFSSLLLRVWRDDGVVVYLNGTEIFRDNMNTPISSGQLATAGISGLDRILCLTTNALASLLVGGSNTLAAEIHPQWKTSPDLRFDAELIGLTPNLGPSLTVAPSQLGWPGWAAGFALFGATNLAPSITWRPVTNTPVLTNGQWRVAGPTSSASENYFRLQVP